MSTCRLFLLLVLAHPAVGCAQANRTISVPPRQQLHGLDADEAAALIAKVEEAQRQLRAGESLSFELLAGSMASNAMTKVSPREAFLQVPFRRVWKIDRVRTDNRLWQPYKLSYAPSGIGQLYWEIEVVLGSSGDIERVLMIYKIPAPF